jgi:OPA family glycerol-3-phosphate transporter-like MFS transporter
VIYIVTNDLSLTAEQRRITLTAWATYACFYLGRLNLSVALPTLAVTLGASRAEVGVLGTVFFWTYGIGTLVSGELGNVVRPRLLVAGGLLVVILANLVFSVQDTLLIMAILWGINGFAQSTGWSPLLRVITDHLSLPQRKRISTLFPISFQIGAAATWIIAGSVIAVWGWRAAFWISGLLLCLTLAHWWWSRIDGIPGQSSRFDRTSTVRELRHYMPLLLANALGGFVLVGSILWTPTYVVDTGYVSAAATGVVSALLPLIGILGMVASSLLVRRSGRAEIAAMQLLVAGAILILIAIPLPVLGQSLVLAVALTVLGGLAG